MSEPRERQTYEGTFTRPGSFDWASEDGLPSSIVGSKFSGLYSTPTASDSCDFHDTKTCTVYLVRFAGPHILPRASSSIRNILR